MNELKPEDVMKALECHENGWDCHSCPMPICSCEDVLIENALALLREKDAEIERLRAHIQEGVELAKEIPEMLAIAQAEAITEFHRKYHEHLDFMNNINKPSPSWNNDDVQRVIVACGAIADQVKEEMKGETDEN